MENGFKATIIARDVEDEPPSIRMDEVPKHLSGCHTNSNRTVLCFLFGDMDREQEPQMVTYLSGYSNHRYNSLRYR